MSPEEFRRQGHAVVDWIADYHSRIESFPVLSRVQPGEIRAKLPPSAPEHGEAFDQILGDIERVILPGITHWQSPNFYAYFPANASGPAILGDLLSSGLGVQGMLWSTSPACTELETHVLDWLVPMLGLPEKFLSTGSGGGVIQDTASSASLCALLAARERATQVRQQSQRLRRTPGCLLLHANAFFGRKGDEDRGHGLGQSAPDRSGQEFRHAPRSAGTPDRARHQGRPDSLLRLRDRGHDIFVRDRSGPRNCRASAASTISGCTWIPP